MAITMGTFKQEFLKLVNKVYVDNFQNGLALSNVAVVKNLIIQTGVSKQLPCLAAFARYYPEVENMKLNSMFHNMLKFEIKESFEQVFGIKVVSAFKDYDSVTGNTLCVLQLEDDLEKYLEDMTL